MEDYAEYAHKKRFSKDFEIKNQSDTSLLTVCFYHVKYGFQSESTPYSSLNVEKTPCSKET